MKRDGYLTSGEWPERVSKSGAHHGPYGLLLVFGITMMCCWGWLFYLLCGALR